MELPALKGAVDYEKQKAFGDYRSPYFLREIAAMAKITFMADLHRGITPDRWAATLVTIKKQMLAHGCPASFVEENMVVVGLYVWTPTIEQREASGYLAHLSKIRPPQEN
jgi:hypothetical protein